MTDAAHAHGRAHLVQLSSMLGAHGLPCREVQPLSVPGRGRKSRRAAFRVTLADGSIVKVRLLESTEEAHRLAELRRDVPPPFVPVIDRHAHLLVEPWIDGEPLTPPQAEGRAEELGAVLGTLHAAGCNSTRGRVPTSGRAERAARQLAELEAADALAPRIAAALLAALARCDPRSAPQTLVHLDYCPENLVVDAQGRLHVIDNEWIRLDAPGLDLGRTHARWAVGDAAWARFLRGYARAAAVDPGPLRFWLIVMAAHSAALRLEAPPAAMTVPLARLRALAASC